MKKVILGVFSVLLICGAIALYLFLPVKEQVDQVHPAILISKETGEVMDTTVTIKGEWSSHRVGKVKHRFHGHFAVSDLGYTMNDRWETKTDLIRMAGSEYLMGFLSYKSDDGTLEASVLYSNEDRTAFIYVDEDVTVILPSNNEDDGKKIADEIGIAYPG